MTHLQRMNLTVRDKKHDSNLIISVKEQPYPGCYYVTKELISSSCTSSGCGILA
jgi:hypothetical protein